MAIIQHPVSEKDKIRYALAGLGDHYKLFETSITTKFEFPSFDELCRHLLEYEALYPSNSTPTTWPLNMKFMLRIIRIIVAKTIRTMDE